MEEKKLPQIKSKVGGQAVIEGVMMRGIDKAAMAVRKESGEIVRETWKVADLKNRKWYSRIPFIRGIFSLVESLTLGYKCLMKSASYIEIEDDEQEPTGFEKKLTDLFGDKLMSVISAIGMVLGVVVAIVLFMFLPALAAKGINMLFVSAAGVDIGAFKAIIEGIIKIVIFIIYLIIISQMKDIKRLFMYHGAEHKSIACYEAGEELTPENAMRFTRFHPRCGTSFLLIVLIISILVFMWVTWDSLAVRVALKILLLPVVVGAAYEIIRLAGKYDNIATRIVSAPGLALQRITTREPDESMLEVAIAALTDALPENREDDRWDL